MHASSLHAENDHSSAPTVDKVIVTFLILLGHDFRGEIGGSTTHGLRGQVWVIR